MSNLTAVVNNIISKVNTHTTDLSNKTTQIATHISGIVAYHLLQGNLAVSNYTTTQGFNTTLYTGNGSTQSITTGIDMSTQWGNDVSEKFGGLVWFKNRTAARDNWLVDTIRGGTKAVSTNTTSAESSGSGYCSFEVNGFNLLSPYVQNNTSGDNYTSWNFQTTHRVTGTTNHGKAYTCHYNPFTGFTMVKYEGSGIAGHEIPHHLGRKLGFIIVKDLTTSGSWIAKPYFGNGGYLHLTNAFGDIVDANVNINNDTSVVMGADTYHINNYSGEQHILYGWANSYFDETNKLIGNYEIGMYQGTGASGNKVSTRGKPAWVMVKALDATSDWGIYDNQRGVSNFLRPNLSNAETTYQSFNFNEDGITTTGTGYNTSGGQYLYMVVYDTNANGGGTYYPLASDTANLQVNNALIPIAQGIDSNGVKNTILSKNETFSGVTYTQGKNYPYYDALGNRGVSNKAPNYGTINPANGGDFYNVLSNKWYTSAGVEITNGRNYLNHIVYADNDGGVLYVEELPKIEYKDIVKANEFKGKNACTAWVNFDGTTTPPTIRDSYNVSAVIRTATGVYDVYFKKPMDTTNYIVSHPTLWSTSSGTVGAYKYINKITLTVYSGGSLTNFFSDLSIHIDGGKN